MAAGGFDEYLMAHLAGWHWADWAPQAFLTLCGWRQVNGQNVEGLRHAEVVARIKAQEDEARLLVVDPETDEHFKRLRVVPTEEHVEGRMLPSGQRVGSVSAAANLLSPQVHCHHQSRTGPALPR